MKTDFDQTLMRYPATTIFVVAVIWIASVFVLSAGIPVVANFLHINFALFTIAAFLTSIAMASGDENVQGFVSRHHCVYVVCKVLFLYTPLVVGIIVTAAKIWYLF